MDVGTLGRWTHADYAKPADVVAPRLLGCVLQVRTDGQNRHARIVETEAYLGERDLACHASKGRTPRTESLYGPPGSAYVDLISGIHRLFNVVTSVEGAPHAVLVRAAEPIDFDGRLHGPGLLADGLGIALADDRSDLVHGRIRILDGTPPERVLTGRRIGVDYAGRWADAPLRFGDAASRHLSKPFPTTD